MISAEEARKNVKMAEGDAENFRSEISMVDERIKNASQIGCTDVLYKMSQTFQDKRLYKRIIEILTEKGFDTTAVYNNGIIISIIIRW